MNCNNKYLLCIFILRNSFVELLNLISLSNPTLYFDLLLTNDTGKELELPEYIKDKFKSVTILNKPEDIYLFNMDKITHEKYNFIASVMDRVSLWQNIAILYAKICRHDIVIFWEDDQIPIIGRSENFFSDQIKILTNNNSVQVAISKRIGFLHRIPIHIDRYIKPETSKILEKSLVKCNEIFFEGLLSKKGAVFRSINQEYNNCGINYFSGYPFMLAGSLSFKINNKTPFFFDMPKLYDSENTRGNDVFFSIGYHDNPKQIVESNAVYFHNPFMLDIKGDFNYSNSLAQENLIDIKFYEQTQKIITGWLSYSCLLVKICNHSQCEYILNAIEDSLSRLKKEDIHYYDSFVSRRRRLEDDMLVFQECCNIWCK